MTAQARFANPELSNQPLTAGELQKILHLQSSILGEAVISDDDVGLLNRLCLLTESFTPDSVASIMLYKAGQQALRMAYAPSLDDAGVQAFNGLKVGEGSCGNAVFHGRPMYVCNTHTDARWERVLDLAQRFGIRACWSFPLRNEDGEPMGSFAISSFEERSPQSFHVALLEACTAIAEVILARKSHAQAREAWLKEQLKTRKLESLGVLAGGIAHDFNNLLGVILGNIDLVEGGVPASSEAKRNLEAARLGTERARDLTQQLLTFSRGGTPVKRLNDVRAVIRESAEFVLHGSNVMLDFSCGQAPMFLEVDGGQLGQVIQNLVLNARQAMPDGGSIRVDLQSVQADEMAQFRDAHGPYLRIRIKDTGAGIPAELIDKIFDPYFTTRADGNGLGLALSHSIVQKHKGYLEVHSDVGAGTEFAIYLPAPEVRVTDTPDESDVLAVQRDRGIALIMDDEPLMRTTARAMVEHLGFDVWEAENGTQALARYREARAKATRIDIAIMDLTVPGEMGGVEAIAKIQAEFPDALAIVSSGYSAVQAMSNYRDYGFNGAVAKPYSLKELEAGICAALRESEMHQSD